MNKKSFILFSGFLAFWAVSGSGADNIGNSRVYLIADVGANFVPKITFNSISLQGPGHFESDDLSVGVRGTIGVGYNIVPEFALEAEMGFSYNEATVNTGTLGGTAAGVDVRLWHVPLTLGFNWRPYIPPAPRTQETEIDYGQSFFQRLQPYVGGGIGVAEVFGELEGFPSSTNPINEDDTDTVLTFYVKAGLTYPITPHADLGIQYRFYGGPGFSIKGSETDDYYAHALSAVFRWKF